MYHIIMSVVPYSNHVNIQRTCTIEILIVRYNAVCKIEYVRRNINAELTATISFSVMPIKTVVDMKRDITTFALVSSFLCASFAFATLTRTVKPLSHLIFFQANQRNDLSTSQHHDRSTVLSESAVYKQSNRISSK